MRMDIYFQIQTLEELSSVPLLLNGALTPAQVMGPLGYRMLVTLGQLQYRRNYYYLLEVANE